MLDIVWSNQCNAAAGAAPGLLAACKVGVTIDIDKLGYLIQEFEIVGKPIISGEIPPNSLKLVIRVPGWSAEFTTQLFCSVSHIRAILSEIVRSCKKSSISGSLLRV